MKDKADRLSNLYTFHKYIEYMNDCDNISNFSSYYSGVRDIAEKENIDIVDILDSTIKKIIKTIDFNEFINDDYIETIDDIALENNIDISKCLKEKFIQELYNNDKYNDLYNLKRLLYIANCFNVDIEKEVTEFTSGNKKFTEEALSRKLSESYFNLQQLDEILDVYSRNELIPNDYDLFHAIRTIHSFHYYADEIFDILKKHNININDTILDSLYCPNTLSDIKDYFLDACNKHNIKLSEPYVEKITNDIRKFIYDGRWGKVSYEDMFEITFDILHKYNINYPEKYIINDLKHLSENEFKRQLEIYKSRGIKLDFNKLAAVALSYKNPSLYFDIISNEEPDYNATQIEECSFDNVENENFYQIINTDNSFCETDMENFLQDGSNICDIIYNDELYLMFNGIFVNLGKDDENRVLYIDADTGNVINPESNQIIISSKDNIKYFAHQSSKGDKLHLSDTSKFSVILNSMKENNIYYTSFGKGTDNILGAIKLASQKVGITNGDFCFGGIQITMSNGEVENINYNGEFNNIINFVDCIRNGSKMILYGQHNDKKSNFNMPNVPNVSTFSEDDYENAIRFGRDEITDAIRFMLDNAFYLTEAYNEEDYEMYYDYTSGSGHYNHPLRMMGFSLDLVSNKSLYNSYEMISDMEMIENRLKKPMVVFRGCSLSALFNSMGLPSNFSETNPEEIVKLLSDNGNMTYDPAFTSTGIASGREFGGEQVNIEIELPKGTQGIFVDPVSHYEFSEQMKRYYEDYENWQEEISLAQEEGRECNLECPNIHDYIKDESEISKECEYVIQAGSNFEITGAEYDEKHDKYKVKMRLVSQRPIGFCEILAKWINETYGTDINIDVDRFRNNVMNNPNSE